MKALITLDELPRTPLQLERVKRALLNEGFPLEHVRVWTGTEDWDPADIEKDSRAWELLKGDASIRPCEWLSDPSNPSVISDYEDDDGELYPALSRDWSADTNYRFGCIILITTTKEPKKPKFL